jgi:hypothetical protein
MHGIYVVYTRHILKIGVPDVSKSSTSKSSNLNTRFTEFSE